MFYFTFFTYELHGICEEGRDVGDEEIGKAEYLEMGNQDLVQGYHQGFSLRFDVYFPKGF